jgi:hypothetical protein
MASAMKLKKKDAPATGGLTLGPNIETAWIVVVAWAAVELVIFCMVKDWPLVGFTVLFGFVFGLAAWHYRKKVRPAFKRVGLDNLAGFLLLAFLMSVFEEVLCYGLGNHVANKILWADLIQVGVSWLFWFASWYLYIAKHYKFSEKEALLVGASVGILFETVSSGAIFGNPFSLLMAPLAIIIYAGIFVLPLQFIDLKGTSDSSWKYPVGIILPYLASLPMGVLLAIVLPK